MPYAGGTKGRVARPTPLGSPKAITARVLSEECPTRACAKGRVARPTPLWTPKGANSLLDPLPRGYPRHDLMACLAGQDKPYVGHGTRYRKREARTDQGVVNSPWRPQAITPKACFECPATGRTPYAGGTKGRVARPTPLGSPKAITARVLSEECPTRACAKGRVARPTPLWTPKGANSLLDPLPRGYPRHDLMACLAGQDKPYVGHGTRYRKREARADQSRAYIHDTT